MKKSSYANFLKDRVRGTSPTLPEVYHAVRRIPYGSTGERDPVKIIANNLGSCSGKHILLRDLLRESGWTTEVVTMFTHFNRDMPSHPSMPADLRTMIEGPDVCDFHHYVRVRVDDRWLKLDATWHDELIPFGFSVNSNWKGDEDTRLAARPLKEYPAVEDLAAWKVQMLTELTDKQRDLRSRFFHRVTEWMMTL